MGLEPGPALDEVRRLYDVVLAGFSALPIPLPATAFTRAKSALVRIFQIFEQNIERHRTSPRDDGLSRILAARLPDGRGVTTEEAKIELHHIVVAGFIVWAWIVTAVLELDAQHDIRTRLTQEVREKAPGPLSLDILNGMPYLAKVVDEVRRMSPVVPVAFGKARDDFEFRGFRIPKGWMVLWGLRSSHMRPEIYTDPERFDPERFAPQRAEHTKHRCAYVPNGAGDPLGHKCAGYEFAPIFLKVFLVGLLRGYTYEVLSPQDLSYDWSKIPPEPKDGFRASIRSARV
jgi:cytochrome P450